MNRDKILSALETKWLGRDLVLLDETDSTNSHAGRLLSEKKLRHGTVVIAEKQSAGRGRLNREWYSDGGLCMTAALEMEQSGDTLGAITLTAGVAVVQALQSLTGHEFKLKYPNDIIANGKKIGGILSELKLGEKTVVLLGIGINVEQESFPGEIAGIATSLRLLGVSAQREEAATAVINSLEQVVEIFIEHGFARVRPHWIEANCTLGKEITVEQPAGKLQGKAINIDDSGGLLVETDSGVERVTTGDFLMGGRA